MTHHKQYLKPFQVLTLRLLTLPLIFLIAYVVYGFLTNNLTLLKIYPEAPSITPVTIFCFAIIFLATWAVIEQWKTLTTLLALALIAISAYSLLQNYSYPPNLSIEMATSTRELSFHALSFEVSISFIAIALMLLIIRRKKLRTTHLVIASFLNWVVLSMALLSLLYYIFYQPGITTREHLSMPFPTTIGLLYLVIIYAVFIIFHIRRLYPSAFSRWLILSLILIGVTGGYAIWFSTKNLETAFFRYLSSEIGTVAKASITEYIKNRRAILENVLYFLDHPNDANDENWIREVSIFIQQNPEILVIVGYVPEKNTFWEVNASGSDQKIERLYHELKKFPNQEIIVDDQALSPAFILSNRTEDSSKSWMAIMVDINLLVSQLSDATIRDRAGIAITWDKSLLFIKYANDQKYRIPYGVKAELDITTPPLSIEVWPTTKQYRFLKTPLPNIILTFELSVLILACLIFYYAELARIKGSQYQKAEEEKTAFFANISHEIRTQLQGIMGTGSVLEKTTLTDKQQRMLNTIKASGNVLQRLLNDLLDLTKFEMGRMKLNEKPTSVSQCVREVVGLMTPKAEEKGLKIHLKIEPNLPPIIYLDSDRFGQIISNLISNAIKFTNEGSITVSANTHIIEDTSRKMLIVKVEDTGIGIPEHSLKKIFDKFYQVHTQHNRTIEGTGLGLSISLMLAEYMNGTITCESVIDKGSTFTLMLPVLFEERKQAEHE